MNLHTEYEAVHLKTPCNNLLQKICKLKKAANIYIFEFAAMNSAEKNAVRAISQVWYEGCWDSVQFHA